MQKNFKGKKEFIEKYGISMRRASIILGYEEDEIKERVKRAKTRNLSIFCLMNNEIKQINEYIKNIKTSDSKNEKRN